MEVGHRSNPSTFNDYNDSNSAFEKLKEIQTLLKKESALKELFIKTSNETKKNIEEQCKEMYKKKLDVFQMFKKIRQKNDKENKKYELVNDLTENLKDLSNYIPKLLKYLWDDPKTMATLLKNSQIDDIKKSLAPMITNNFYENILSFNYIQDNFLYVISILLKDEIDNLKSTNDVQKFLQDTPCGCILDQLINKIEIQSYFKNILFNIIEIIDKNCSNRVMTFHVKEIEKQIKKNSIKKEKKQLKIKTSKFRNDDEEEDEEQDVYRRENFSTEPNNTESILSTSFDDVEAIKGSYDKFCADYIPDIDATILNKKIEEYDDIKMKNYFEFQLKSCKEKEDIYSNKTLMNILFKLENSDKLLGIYQNYFMKVIKIIERIFNRFLHDIQSAPYSVKCLCKIISVLIKKKFPKITAAEENAFIAKFFFCKLFAPIFRNPSAHCLINEFIISNKTLLNLDIICPIVLQLVSGRFFRHGEKHGEYTPFNKFFMDEMPFVLKFFDNITKVRIPLFINKFILDKLEKNFVYDYFKENPDEVIFHRSICFNIYDVNCLLNNMKNCQDILFKDSINKGLQKTFEKIFSIKKNQLLLKELKNKQDSLLKPNIITSTKNIISASGTYTPKNTPISKKENHWFDIRKSNTKKMEEEKNKTCIVYYYLITDLMCNPKYKLFNLTQKTPNFTLKELDETKNENEVILNNTIKIKNFFSSLLCNYRNLVKEDFDISSNLNLVNILKELRNYAKSENYVIDGSIPSQWYISSILAYLKNLPNDLTNNDCEKLFESMKTDLNKSIKELDFETLSYCLSRIRFVHKGISYYENTKEILIDILLNYKVKKIIEEENIKVQIDFEYGKKKRFKIRLLNKEKQLRLLDNLFSEDKTNERICKTIEEFSKIFPNFSEIDHKYDVGIFEMQNELEVPKKLKEYFEYIRECIKKNKNITEEKLSNLMYEKISDYVMGKIYDKIFPIDTNKKDDLIYNNSIILSWVEPRHFIPGKKNYVCEGFLPDVIKNFDILDKVKSPFQKLKTMSNIFNSIRNLIKFNTGDSDTGVDDEIPILNYSLVRACPQKIYSNCKFMELYIGDLKSKREGNQLTQLLIVCERTCEINNDSLINVSKEEYNRKCTECREGISPEEEEEKSGWNL